MVTLSRDFWAKVLVTLSLLTFVFGGLRMSADIRAGDLPLGLALQPALILLAGVFTLRLFATLWTWAGKTYGYIVLGLLSLADFWGIFLQHALEVGGARGFEAIAEATPEAWAPLFLIASGYAGIVTAAQVIIVVYLLVRGRSA